MNEGLPTGIAEFDRLTGGLMPGELTVVAACPLMGKTSLALNIVERLSVVAPQPQPVGFFTLETSAQQLVAGLCSSLAGVDPRTIHSGRMTAAECAALAASAKVLAKSAIYVDDTAPLTIDDLEERARRMREIQRIELLVIDYFQLIQRSATSGEAGSPLQGSVIAASLRTLARELGIPILVLAHLRRRLGRADPGKPQLSDLGDAHALGECARTVALLWRDRRVPSLPNDDLEETCRAELTIVKAQKGAVAVIPLVFDPVHSRFEACGPEARAQGSSL